MVTLVVSLAWFTVLYSVAGSMTTLATGTVQLTTLNCGNAACEYPHETNANCPADCYCGDGYCHSGYEDSSSCPSDCPAPPPEEITEPPSRPPSVPEPVLPTSINETLDLEGASFVHIYAEFVKPTSGASASVEYIDCEALEKMTYGDEIPFKCFFMETRNLADVNLEDAQIISKVRKDWVAAYNINLSTIKLVRFYRNRRLSLPTELIMPEDERFWIDGYDPKNYYFLSSTDGFAGFFLAVGSAKEPAPPITEKPRPYCGDNICDGTIGEGCGTCPIDCCCLPGYECVSNECVVECLLLGVAFGKYLGLCWYWWLVIAALVLAIICLLWRNRRKPIPVFLVLMVALAVFIPIAFLAGRFRRRKSRWERLVEGLRKALDALEQD